MTKKTQQRGSQRPIKRFNSQVVLDGLSIVRTFMGIIVTIWAAVMLTLTSEMVFVWALAIGVGLILGQKIGDIATMRTGMGGGKEENDKKA